MYSDLKSTTDEQEKTIAALQDKETESISLVEKLKSEIKERQDEIYNLKSISESEKSLRRTVPSTPRICSSPELQTNLPKTPLSTTKVSVESSLLLKMNICHLIKSNNNEIMK